MLKRVSYISRFAQPLDGRRLQELGEAAERKNESLGVTGVLMTSGGIFYQVLEGPAEIVDELMATIHGDERHTDILVLRTETPEHRSFPDWSMRMVNLDAASHLRLLPLKALILALFKHEELIQDMIWAIERTVQHEMRQA